MTTKNFTMIELLVIVFCIAILAALQLPAINATLDDGLSTACTNNLRLIGQGTAAYAEENNGYYTHYRKWDDAYWNNILFEDGYLKQRQNCYCPIMAPAQFNRVYTYGVLKREPNYWKKMGTKGNDPFYALIKNQITNPSIVTYYSDTCAQDKEGTHQYVWNEFFNKGTQYGAFDFRHGECANIWFLDGHVASMKPTEVNDTISQLIRTEGWSGLVGQPVFGFKASKTYGILPDFKPVN